MIWFPQRFKHRSGCGFGGIFTATFAQKQIGATRKTGGSNWGYKPLTLTRA